ncbi:hypothetical protein RJ641_001367 [Dillenia turbinata]|uniref:Uncharacterized protein n=1 Tax=Dillenia turbinata TaxID=194707 RepID=A0AAN8ZN66_9MAGN
MEKETPKPLCVQEALELLNCVAGPSFDQDKCLVFLQALRDCVLNQDIYAVQLHHDPRPTDDIGKETLALKMHQASWLAHQPLMYLQCHAYLMPGRRG